MHKYSGYCLGLLCMTWFFDTIFWDTLYCYIYHYLQIQRYGVFNVHISGGFAFHIALMCVYPCGKIILPPFQNDYRIYIWTNIAPFSKIICAGPVRLKNINLVPLESHDSRLCNDTKFIFFGPMWPAQIIFEKGDFFVQKEIQ